jgi:hypothetical protein
MFEYDKFYRECQQQNKPFIKAKINPLHKNYFVQIDLMKINPLHKNYFVQIDLMTCNHELSDAEQDNIKQLINNEIDYVKSNTNYDFQGFSIDKELAWFDGISSEHLDSFCNALYDLTQKNHN